MSQELTTQKFISSFFELDIGGRETFFYGLTIIKLRPLKTSISHHMGPEEVVLRSSSFFI